MTTIYRVRFSRKPTSSEWRMPDAQTADLEADLDQIPGMLPADSYIMSIEDVATGNAVHWTRWPVAYRPGFGG